MCNSENNLASVGNLDDHATVTKRPDLQVPNAALLKSLAFDLSSPYITSNSRDAAPSSASRQRLHPTHKPARMIGVFLPTQPSKTKPDRYVSPENAQQLVNAGHAISINRGNGIRLRERRQWRVGKSRYSGFVGSRLETL